MKLHTNRASLLPIVNRVAMTEGQNKSNAIATVTATAASIWIRSVGTESAHEGTAACGIDKEGSAIVDAKMLRDAVSSLPNGVIAMSLEKSHLMITGGGAKLKIPISISEALAIPDLDDLQTITVDAKAISLAIMRVRASIALSGQVGTGAHLESLDGMIRLVTTDRHRLSRAECPCDQRIEVAPNSLIAPIALDGLSSMLDGGISTVDIAIGSGWLRATAGAFVSWWRMIEGGFPDYAPFMPITMPASATMHRGTWLDSLKRANGLAGVTGGALHTFGPDGCAITCHNVDGRELDEDVACKFVGDPIAVGFNPQYLSDILTAHGGDQITIGLVGTMSPCRIDTGGAMWIIMPRVIA